MTASRTWTAWSCTVRLTVDDPAVLGAACGELKALMDRVDKAASRFRPDSELSVVNTRAGALVPVSRLLVDLVDVSLVAAQMSGGAVDPTVGRAMRAIGYDTDFSLVASDGGPIELRLEPIPGWAAIELSVARREVRIRRGVELDLGSTAPPVTRAARRAAAIASARSGLIETRSPACALSATISLSSRNRL